MKKNNSKLANLKVQRILKRISVISKWMSSSFPFSLWTILGIVLVSLVIFAIEPKFFSMRNIKNIPYQASFLSIVSIGQAICILAGGFDLSLAGSIPLIMTIGMFYIRDGGNPYLGWLIMLVVGVLLGLVNGFSISILRMSPFIVTLSTYIIYAGLALFLLKGFTLTAEGAPGWKLFIKPGYGSIFKIPIAIIVAVICYALFILVMRRTVLGRYIYAIGGNREAAVVSGINVRKYTIVIYALSGLTFAITSILLIGRLQAVNATLGSGLLFQSVAAVVIGNIALSGGTGYLEGVILGVILLQIIENGITLTGVSPFLTGVVRGGAIFVAVLVDALRGRKIT
jgi:ribose transport system permease protein